MVGAGHTRSGNDVESRFLRPAFSNADGDLGRVTLRLTSETAYNSVCDSQALYRASRVAEVLGPVTFWYEA
jgi:hypothetical protein